METPRVMAPAKTASTKLAMQKSRNHSSGDSEPIMQGAKVAMRHRKFSGNPKLLKVILNY